MREISFPVLLRFKKDVFVGGEQLLRDMEIKRLTQGLLLCKEKRSTAARFRWMLEASGIFREFQYVGVRRKWAQPLSFLWRFALDEYHVTPGRPITVGELESKLTGIAKGDDEPDEPLSDADLRVFLAKRDKSEIVTEDLLRTWRSLA